MLRVGGRFGYVEHVRVRDDDARPLLGIAQQALDPLQQVIAHGCHLTRDTPQVVREAFGGAGSEVRTQRLVEESMWPVSQLAAGVVRKQA